MEGFSLRTALREVRAVRGRQSLWKYIRTTKSPELPTVVLEDTGAIAGLVVALVALVLSWKVDPIWDGVGTVVISALLAVIAVVLAVEMKSLLIGEGASASDMAAISAAIEGAPDVDRLIHLRTEHVGPEQILVAAKVGFVPGLSFVELAAAIDTTEAAIRAAVPTATLVYLEPDLYRSPAA
jgi:divalent metal cation (Fe/Co/Zn/Cd) transporter